MALVGGATALSAPAARTPAAAASAGEALAGLLFTTPALLVFGVFMFVPLALTAYYSLTDFSGFGEARLQGVANFADIFADPLFWTSMRNTGVYTVVTVPLSVLGGLGLALLLNKAMPARGLLRALFYVPVVISSVASGIVARWMFNEDFGLINRLLGGVGLPGLHWQTGGTAAMVSLMLVSVWQNVGLTMVVYLAGLQGIPGETYEAAAMDGASRWRVTRSITWPMLAPTTFFLLIYMVINSFQVFDLVIVMTGGGPANATTLLVNYAYSQGFEQRRQGYAAALGVVLYVIVLVLTLLQWRSGRRRDYA